MKTDPKATAARAFVRSLNILLKFARLYGYEHARVEQQLKIAWGELRTAIPEGAETGLLLGASGAQLILDGVPLEGSPAEKQFAQLLSAAGLASLQFTQQVTEEELAKFVHAFPTGKAKPAELAEQLKAAITDARGIRVNEICFVATDSRLKESSMAAQIAAASMGDQQDQFRKMLNDPKKLLELIAAAEGSKTGGEAGARGEGAGPGAGEGWGGGGAGAEGIGEFGGGTGAGGTGGGIGGGVFRPGRGVTPPRAIFSPTPEFSEEARKAKYQGTCTLMIVVATDGRPTNIRVVNSLGMGLDEKAIETVKTWKFEPAMKDGKPVAVQISVEVEFRLY